MYAKIIKDHLDLSDLLGPDWHSRTGDVIIHNGATGNDTAVEVRLLDDDRELYYTALATDDAFEPLLSWAMRDAGATILQTKDANGAWEDVIS